MLPAAGVPPVEAFIRIHHHLHGRPGGYIGLAVAAAIGWVGVPGAGEAALVAAAVFAARGKLDLAEVLVIAWMGATAGGIAGWVLGRHAGQALLTAPGPLRRQRVRALARGERFFARYGILAVYLAPSWAAGTAEMSLRRFLPANGLAALIWVLLIGGGTYLIGPSIADLAGDLGLIGVAVVAVTVAAGAIGARRRRRRRRQARASGSDPG